MTIELVRWIRERAGEEIRYRRTLRELRRIDERTLDDLALGGLGEHRECPVQHAGRAETEGRGVVAQPVAATASSSAHSSRSCRRRRVNHHTAGW